MTVSDTYDELVFECKTCGCETYQENDGSWWIINNSKSGHENYKSKRPKSEVLQ